MKIIDNSECLCDFGRYIRDKREKKDLFQSDVAKEVGISQVYYSMIERGERKVDLYLAINICNVLDLDMKDFISKYL
jgi:transcriptional regulator with XRE-family HTH domain